MEEPNETETEMKDLKFSLITINNYNFRNTRTEKITPLEKTELITHFWLNRARISHTKTILHSLSGNYRIEGRGTWGWLRFGSIKAIFV